MTTQLDTKTDSDFSQWFRATEWVEQHGGQIFPSFASYDWFKRQHRSELVEAGVLISKRGRAGDLLSADFPQVALAILRRESA